MTAARRLAAVLAADVVGYSRLMGEDEAGTAKAVRERRDAAQPIVANLGGRIVKTTGDGVLLEFSSVVAAVECAIAIQKLMAERNTGLPEGKCVLYRVGVNLGDVLIEGDDIVGDGVNIAARLEGVCEPGAFMFQAPPTTTENAFAHLCLGVVYTWTNRASLGIRECERALELDRNLANAHGQIGMAKVQLGQAKDTETSHPGGASPQSPRRVCLPMVQYRRQGQTVPWRGGGGHSLAAPVHRNQ